MKKCIVINRIPLGEEGKLRRKHYEQVETFIDLGFDTYYVGYDDSKCYLVHNGEKKFICDASLHGYKSYKAMFKAVKYACKKYGPFDIAYMRMIPAFPGLISFLKSIRPSCESIVYEFPTYPYDGENGKRVFSVRNIAKYSDRICRKKLKKYVDLSIVFTDELESLFGIPTIVLRNGIIVDKYRLKSNLPSDKIEILCMGKLQNWHGYDRIIAGAIEYKKTHADIPFKLHIIGDGNARALLIEQAKSGGLDETIIDFPGIVVGNELDDYFDKCSIAIESLGMHRLNLKYSSTLKSREYLARGIPFAYTLHIPGIDDECDYCYKIPVDESPVDMEKLLKWEGSLKSDVGMRMRKHAKNEFSWKSQFTIMLNHLEQMRGKE